MKKIVFAVAVGAVVGYFFARRGVAGLLVERYSLNSRVNEMKAGGWTAAEKAERAAIQKRVAEINALLNQAGGQVQA